MLSIRQLGCGYGDLQVLWDVELEVTRGEIVTVLGANGAGKSTLLRTISGLVRARSGSLRFEGVDLAALPPHQVVAAGVVQIPEGRRIFPQMTVMENLRMGSYPAAARRDRQRNLDRVFALFPRLAERSKQLGETMSGGEQQMLAIARGLMANPKLLLLDEPSLGLSPLLVEDIFDLVQQINRQGTTVLLVEQNVYQALRVCHRGYVLENGRVVLQGTGASLMESPRIKSAFLGM
jgi:branched-chain amino acid transport system ATP-binding protein